MTPHRRHAKSGRAVLTGYEADQQGSSTSIGLQNACGGRLKASVRAARTRSRDHQSGRRGRRCARAVRCARGHAVRAYRTAGVCRDAREIDVRQIDVRLSSHVHFLGLFIGDCGPRLDVTTARPRIRLDQYFIYYLLSSREMSRLASLTTDEIEYSTRAFAAATAPAILTFYEVSLYEPYSSEEKAAALLLPNGAASLPPRRAKVIAGEPQQRRTSRPPRAGLTR